MHRSPWAATARTPLQRGLDRHLSSTCAERQARWGATSSFTPVPKFTPHLCRGHACFLKGARPWREWAPWSRRLNRWSTRAAPGSFRTRPSPVFRFGVHSDPLGTLSATSTSTEGLPSLHTLCEAPSSERPWRARRVCMGSEVPPPPTCLAGGTEGQSSEGQPAPPLRGWRGGSLGTEGRLCAG